MKRTLSILALALTAGLAAPVAAQNFAANSQAKPWGLTGEQKARFEARVVDVLCELSGDCPDNCGDGARQLGLVRSADDALLIANKNTQPIFSGAVVDLLPYCGAAVEVDGLLVGEMEPKRLFQVQLIRRAGEEKFAKTNLFSKAWNEKNPELAKVKGPWFRKDPQINALIERDGYLGLGLETDAAFIEEEFGE